jgi:alpha-L-rhamnosidase
VQVTGFPGKPTPDNLCAKVVHTAFDSAGKFECSNELLNRIQHNALWSYLSNFVGYPTDCPHREKNGWTGDAQLAAEMGLYNFHPAAAYTKWMADFRDEQPADGQLPGIIPTSGWGYGHYGSPAWGSACILVPWYMYQHRGDERVLAEQYENMKLFVKHLQSLSTDNIVKHGLGDWCPPEGNGRMKCPKTITSTGYYYVDSLIISKIAAMLGKDDEAKEYAELAAAIRKSYNEQLYEGDGIYVSGCETALACPVFQGIVEPAEKDKVVEKLVAEVERQNRHIDTGILGAKYLFRVLTENGRADLAYEIATQTTYPSYGNWLERGATTLWEMWDGGGSQNHIMFGDISAWFYKALAGIDLDPQRPAFKHIIIRPYPVGDLKWAKAEHESMYGLIRSSWQRDGEAFTLDVTIPANTTATVYVPAKDAASAGELSDIKPSACEGGRAVFEVGSGNYSFQSRMPARVL